MQNVLGMINFLLAQTAEEKRLTILYVSLFCFLMIMLVIDSVAKKKWTGDSKGVIKKTAWVFLIIGLIALAVLYFVL